MADFNFDPYMSGYYGANESTENDAPQRSNRSSHRSATGFDRVRNSVGVLEPERIVDIVCASIIVLFLIIVAVTWQSFSAALFEVLFTIIYIGSRILSAILGLGAVVGGLCIAFRRRRRYWW